MSTQNPFDREQNLNHPSGAGPYGAPMHPVAPPAKKINIWLIVGLIAV